MINAGQREPLDTSDHTLPISDIVKESVYPAIHEFMQAAAGNHPDATRPAGLFLVNEDLQKVKRFCKYMSQLPTELRQVQDYLGFHDSFIPGLQPVDVAALHRELKGFAEFWYEIENDMRNVTANLVTFSVELESFGNPVVEFIKKMAGYLSYQGVVGEVTAEDLQSLPEKPLSQKDLPKLDPLVQLTQELVETVEEHREAARKVKDKVVYFRTQLRDVRDDITRKLKRLVDNGVDSLTADANAELDRLNDLIEDSTKKYSTFTKYTFVGLWWGPVGLAISASIYGPQAIAAKNEQATRLAEKQAVEAKLKSLNRFMASLSTVETDLQNMQLLTDEALNGAGSLENIWLMIGDYIASSVRRIKDTKSATTLFIFESRLSHMIAQWGNVEKQAKILMQVLSQDTEELNLPNKHQPEQAIEITQ